jgi:hypothetical protein
LIPLSREPAVLAYHLRELTVSANPGKLRRHLGGRESPVVSNLPLLFTEVTSLGASSSGTPPQGAGSSSKSVDWEPAVLAHYHRELAVLANLWTGSQQFWHTTIGRKRF